MYNGVLLVFVLVISALIFYVLKFILGKIKSSTYLKNSRFFNPLEYMPIEEIMTLKQVYYLVMILVLIIIILYLIFDWADGLNFIYVLDILLSTFFIMKLDTSSLKGKVLYVLLIPLASLSGLFFDYTLLILYNIFHIFALSYYIEVYYRKFLEYTENNGLGITIILLFSIITVSFLFTILAENVSPLDSMTMVTNAFTSNSFEASGKTVVGKLDSLLLAWGGYILSGVGTATLSVSIIKGFTNKRFDHLEELIKKNKK
ncbi:MAG: hypothetical protein BZ138_03105 [Methanosphaera sp. rholeuAM270]|nr:MAG: hypothetical protein BZ138_03105 [Methanosphaera sp. rholeuAM270]